jgi:hypothetical protein
MKKFFTLAGMILTATLFGALPAGAQTTPPRVLYTDLDGGPKTGGEGNNGAIVTIYGKNFGATQGSSTVTIGGGAPAAVKRWCALCDAAGQHDMISVALGGAVASGPVVVTVGGVASNNTVSFTVRTGNIFYVATTGADSNAGTFAAPFGTILKCRDTMAAGDICYLEGGFVANTNDGNGWHSTVLLRAGGSSTNPKAFVAYPNAAVTVGDPAGTNDQQYGFRNDGAGGWFTISGGGGNFTVVGGATAGLQLNDVGGWRIVGLHINCPNCNGQDAGLVTASVNDGTTSRFYGNEVTNVSTGLANGSGKQYHAVYFTTDSNHIDFGWNHVHDNKTCRAIQFHSSPTGAGTGNDQYDLHVHDNLIHGDPCDGLNLATVDPSRGTVEVYNNVIYSVGRGPGPPDGDANYTCIYSPGTTNTGSAGKGQILVYNNTLYDCGARAVQLDSGWGGAIGSLDSGAGLSIKATNNIIYLIGGEFYLQNGSNATGDHNVFFGSGAAPAAFTSSINSDPLFASLGSFNFHLQSSSPAVDAGVNTGVTTDFDGILRPQGKAFDLGAFEFLNSTVVKPNPPSNLAVVVK